MGKKRNALVLEGGARRSEVQSTIVNVSLRHSTNDATRYFISPPCFIVCFLVSKYCAGRV